MLDTRKALDTFTQGYLVALFWSDLTDDEEEFDSTQLAPEALARIIEDCKDFQEQNTELLAEYCDRVPGHQDLQFDRMASAGSDFALTRNRHGAGFWDRGLGELGDKLTQEAHNFGTQNLIAGEDGTIYVG